MDELFILFSEYINDGLILAVAGNPAIKDETVPVKIRIKSVIIKQKLMFAVTRTVGKKELHENLEAEAAARLLARAAFPDEGLQGQCFRQLEVKNEAGNVVVLVSKKGKVTIKKHRAEKSQRELLQNCEAKPQVNAHNRSKQYVIAEGEPVPFLVELGVMTAQGKVVNARYDKFKQINRYLEFVEDVLPSLPKEREISIIDFGCGKSYLTFALYYYLHEKKGYEVSITGLDLKADVIAHCNELAERFGYDKLKFLHGDIADYTGTDSVDMVVTLHACDTATDYALYKAVKWNAKVIFCVPCCQHELNRQINDPQQASVFKYGLIKERMAALYTDAFRANMLEEHGYKTQILEFIDMEHTPKNILIRAVKGHKQMLPKGADKKREYTELMEQLQVKPTLYQLLNEQAKDNI